MARLKYVGATDDAVWIVDLLKENNSYAVQVRGADLVCIDDRSNNCRHVGFAWAMPEVYKVMKEHGIERP